MGGRRAARQHDGLCVAGRGGRARRRLGLATLGNSLGPGVVAASPPLCDGARCRAALGLSPSWRRSHGRTLSALPDHGVIRRLSLWERALIETAVGGVAGFALAVVSAEVWRRQAERAFGLPA